MPMGLGGAAACPWGWVGRPHAHGVAWGGRMPMGLGGAAACPWDCVGRPHDERCCTKNGLARAEARGRRWGDGNKVLGNWAENGKGPHCQQRRKGTDGDGGWISVHAAERQRVATSFISRSTPSKPLGIACGMSYCPSNAVGYGLWHELLPK